MDFARPDAIEAFLHLHVYKELQESGVSGATVCVAKLGRYSFTLPTCYGFADASRGVVLDPRSSLFDLGTCAKLLAALALLQLLQESGLTVTADVNSMLPPSLKLLASLDQVACLVTAQHASVRMKRRSPALILRDCDVQIDTSRYGTVTVQHLLTHTSGLQRGNGGGGGNPDMRAAAATEDDSSSAAAATGQSQRPSSELPPPEGPESRTQVPERGGDTLIMSYLLAQPVYCAKPPGTYRPCDVDYMLIGAIIEYLTAEPYDTYTKDVLLDPLGIRLPPQPREPQGGGESGAAAAAAMATVLEAADGTTGDRPSVFVHVRQQDLDQARPQARAQDGDPNQGGGPVVPSTSEGAVNAGGGAGMEVEPPREPEAGPSVAMDKKVLARYDPPQLTPVGGLVLTAVDIGRLLPLFLHNSAAAGGDQDGAGSGGVGRSLLASLYEIRLYDFTKDVGVAYGGLVSLGLGHCGDRVVSCESPPPPPSTREIALTAQATAQAAAQAARAAAADAAVAEAEAEVAETEADGSPVEAVAATGTEQLITDSQPPQDQDPDSQQLPQQQSQERVGEREQQPRPVAGLSGGGVSGGGVSCRGSAGGGAGTLSFLGHPSLLLVAPDSGFALLVACNTAGPEGTTFCRHVAVKLLERYRPAELPRSVVRSWLAPVPPPRQDAIVHLVAFPPSCCLNPITYFDGWSLSMPDYVKAPGHGTRRHESCELRLTKLVPPAAAALLAGLPADAPLVLFGHGLGALWAFEVARRLECLYQRQLLHLFVCACAAPACFPPPMRAAGGAGDSGAGGEDGYVRRFQTWWLPEQQRQMLMQQKQQKQQLMQQLQRPGSGDAGGGVAGGDVDIPELYELHDEMFITACRNHPRFPRQLRNDIKAILDHLPLLRADIEAESRYTFLPPVPSLCPSVAAVLASVQNRADDEMRISQGLLSCPITVLIPENETALGPEQTNGWEQVTTGLVRFQAVAGDYHCLEERKTRGQVVAAITSALGRQMSVHTPWLAKLRPERAGGRWAGTGGGRPSGGSSRPSSAVGGYGGSGSGASSSGPVLTLHLPPMYPRG